jgi:hypothetical protein
MTLVRPGLALVLVLMLWPTATRAAETDARDYEAEVALPHRTWAAVVYYRHVSSDGTQSFTQDVGVMRAAYILRYKNWAFVPLDVVLPVADVTAYVPAAPGSPAKVAVRASGIGDFLVFPTVGRLFPQGPFNHTYVAFTPYFSFPTGQYDKTHPVNIGTNRYAFSQELGAGQRFFKIIDFELVLNATEYTANNDFATTVMGTPLAGKLQQKPTFTITGHLSVDVAPTFYVSVSYYAFINGQQDATIGGMTVKAVDQEIVHTLRFGAAIRVERGTLVLLQYNQDVAADHGATISRFFGGRISHIW